MLDYDFMGDWIVELASTPLNANFSFKGLFLKAEAIDASHAARMCWLHHLHTTVYLIFLY